MRSFNDLIQQFFIPIMQILLTGSWLHIDSCKKSQCSDPVIDYELIVRAGARVSGDFYISLPHLHSRIVLIFTCLLHSTGRELLPHEACIE
jgi:hypothetical protein